MDHLPLPLLLAARGEVAAVALRLVVAVEVVAVVARHQLLRHSFSLNSTAAPRQPACSLRRPKN